MSEPKPVSQPIAEAADGDMRGAEVVESRVLEVLRRFTSDVTARGMLLHAKRRAAGDGEVAVGDLMAYLQHGIETFVPPDQHADVLASLESLRTTAAPSDGRFRIATEHDALKARVHARALCVDAGARTLTSLHVATAVSELARNILQYASHGELTVGVVRSDPARIRVVAVDRGPGIEDVEAALIPATGGVRHGLRSLHDLADAFHIETGPAGTTVTFEMEL